MNIHIINVINLFLITKSIFPPEIKQLKYRAVTHSCLLIEFLFFGIYIYSTKLFHHGQGD